MRRFPVWAYVVGLVFGAANMLIFYVTGHRGGILGCALLTFGCGLQLAGRGIGALGGWTVARPGWTTGPFVRLYATMGSMIVLVLGLALHEFWVDGFRSDELVPLGIAAVLVVVTIRSKGYVLRHQSD